MNKIVDLIKDINMNKMITKEGYDLSVLNKKELSYFKMMYPKYGVLMLLSEPGLAKTAMLKSIAVKLGWFYIDLRLSQIDETDVGMFPNKWVAKYEKDGVEVEETYLDHIVPRWAYIANKRPTLIHFEELNRAPQAVRNAALQILLEREIGYDFKFNDQVYMCSSGNLGDEDGTDVEEFDSALNGRLIPVRHTLSAEEWFEYYANDNVHQSIIKYITAHPDHYYVSKKVRSDSDRQYASPRSWTILSKFIESNYGLSAPVEEWIDDIQNYGYSYLGGVSTSFLRYLRDTLKINIKDIINNYPSLKSEGIKFNRDKKSELLVDLRAENLSELKPNQLENVKLFLLDLSEDETTAFLLKVLDDDYNIEEDLTEDVKKNSFIIGFLKDRRFENIRDKVLNYVQAKNDVFDE